MTEQERKMVHTNSKWHANKLRRTSGLNTQPLKIKSELATVPFPEWDQSLLCVSTMSLNKLRGTVADTCRGACCSQGPRQRAAGQTEGNSRRHGSKPQDSRWEVPPGFLRKPLQVKTTLQQCSGVVCQWEECNYSWLGLGWPNVRGRFNS